MRTLLFILILTSLSAFTIFVGRVDKPEPRFFMIYYYGLDSLDNFVQGEYIYWAHDGRMPTQEDAIDKLEKGNVWDDKKVNIDILDLGFDFHMIPIEFETKTIEGADDKAAWLGGKKYKALYDKFYK